MRTLLITCLIASLVLSCKSKTNEQGENEDAIARVNDLYLYKSDFSSIFPKDLKGNDSVEFAKNYIDSWIRKNLLLSNAEANLTDDQKDFEQQLEDYRNSLILYIYEKELITQKLDTNVADTEIEEYYNKHSGDFELKDNIVRVLYVKLKKNAPKINKVQTLYKSDKPEDRKALEEYCYQFAENYFLDDESWLLFNDLLKEIPIKTYNEELFLQNNRLVEVEDSSSLYFVNIKGFKVKDSQSPISFEKDNIRNIILNKRKLTLIDKMKNDIYQEGLAQKKFEIFKQ